VTEGGSAVWRWSMRDSEETDGSNERVGFSGRGYRDGRRSLVAEGGAPKGRESAACRTLLVSTWNLGADWGEGGVTRRGGEVAEGGRTVRRSDGGSAAWRWSGGSGGGVCYGVGWECSFARAGSMSQLPHDAGRGLGVRKQR
jgi:hypothetical protein